MRHHNTTPRQAVIFHAPYPKSVCIKPVAVYCWSLRQSASMQLWQGALAELSCRRQLEEERGGGVAEFCSHASNNCVHGDVEQRPDGGAQGDESTFGLVCVSEAKASPCSHPSPWPWWMMRRRPVESHQKYVDSCPYCMRTKRGDGVQFTHECNMRDSIVSAAAIDVTMVSAPKREARPQPLAATRDVPVPSTRPPTGGPSIPTRQ